MREKYMKNPLETVLGAKKGRFAIITHRFFGDIYCKVYSVEKPVVKVGIVKNGYFRYGTVMDLNLGNILNCE